LVVRHSDEAWVGSVLPPDPHGARAKNWTAALDPVDVIEVGGERWLVAGYGPANWVLNTRAHGEVTLRRGSHSETYKVEEVGAEAAIPVLRKYITEIRVTRPYFDATPNSSDGAVAAELSRHAVFRLIPSTLDRHANG
jgi:hypothetical protein